MSSETITCHFEIKINASIKRVYTAFTNSLKLQQWLADTADVSAQKNGRFYLWWNDGYACTGQYKQLISNQEVHFSWHGSHEPSATLVTVSLAENNGETALSLNHSGLGTGSEWDEMRNGIEENWPIMLGNLKFLLEEGIDRRQLNQPMVGVFVSAVLDEVQATKLNFPVTEGIILAGPVPGADAENVDILANDLLVTLNDHPIDSFLSMRQAITGLHAGDKVTAVYYREQEKKEATFALAERPLPSYPANVAEIVAELRISYAELDAELDAVFEDVSESEASYAPSPTDWSAKETVAHLIYTERWYQFYLSLTMINQKPSGFSNESTLLHAITRAYPTIPELLAELKYAEQTTIAAIEGLPDSFFERREDYFNLINMRTFTPGHHRTHFIQMKETIEASRVAK